MEIILLTLSAFVAGLVDAVVGGGGLIQLPALLVAYPSAPLALLLGTNKFACFFGTATAAIRYSRSVEVPGRTVAVAALAAFACSFLGARAVSLLDPAALRPIVVVVLAAVLVFTLLRPSLGALHAPKLTPRREAVVAALASGAIGAYDGFIGPGTGMFLIFAFVCLAGFDFLYASACAKIINAGTNLAALAYFMPAGSVSYRLALTMAAANTLGAFVGSHLSLKRGVPFLRAAFIVIAVALLLKQAQLLFASH